jgi:hypothetical protein
MGDELDALISRINTTEDEVDEVKAAIKTITTGEDADVEALIKKLEFDSRKEAMKALRAKEERLEKLLLRYLDERARLQQQSGAGTSMLPVRQELVMFPCQSSCCMHQHTLQLLERVFVACAFDPA